MKEILNFSDVAGSNNERNFKPLWHKDDSNNIHKQLSLRSLLYTTLPNKKLPRSKRTRSTLKTIVTTEPITIKNMERQEKINRMTEKYLSFDELMHLRKYNLTALSGRRRKEDMQDMPNISEEKKILRDSDTTTVSTSEYTANTPYVRLKYCTRKLTCTWTAASLTDSAGSLIPGGHGSNFGSNTPPGYVEGCTRTSTCTRDFMDRNKMDSLPTEMTTTVDETDNDEDYCERRSLNKRNAEINNSLHKHGDILHSKSGQINLNVTMKIPKIKPVHKYRYNKIRNKNKSYLTNNSSMVKLRRKKSIIRENINVKRSNHITLLSYGDLYYLVLQKILDSWKNRNETHTKCLCNNVDKLKCSYFTLLLTIFVIK